MRKRKDDLYLVAIKEFYVSGDFLQVGAIHLDKSIEKAHVFNKLKTAVKYAKELRGDVLFYGRRRTEFHVYADMYQFKDHDEEG